MPEEHGRKLVLEHGTGKEASGDFSVSFAPVPQFPNCPFLSRQEMQVRSFERSTGFRVQPRLPGAESVHISLDNRDGPYSGMP